MSDPTTLMKQYVEKNKQQINDDSLEFNDGEYGATSPVKPPPVQSAFVKPVITVKEPNGALADEDEQLEQAEREEDAQKVRDQAYIKSLNQYKAALGARFPLENELEKFASVNHLFTFGCISSEELNFPDSTYRKDGLREQQITFRSGGSAGTGKPRTYAEQIHNIDVEYFIDKVEIETYVAPNPKSRGTNFHVIRFEVREPLSMGLLLQTMQLNSKAAGYVNYLEAPWALIMETVGFTDGATTPTYGPRRLFPLKVVNINFTIDTEGSLYSFICSPFNDDAFSDQAQSIPADFKISGATVEQMLQSGLQSLTTGLNTAMLKSREENKNRQEIDVDEYMIIFPDPDKGSDDFLGFEKIDSTALSGDLAFREFDVDAAFATVDNANGPTGYKNYYDQEAHAGEFSNITSADIKRSFVEGRLGFSVKRSNLSEALKKKFAGSSGYQNSVGKQAINPGDDPLGQGNVNFGRQQFVHNKKTGIMTRKGTQIDLKQRTFNFKAGTKIQKIIEEIVLLSDFGKRLTKEGVTSKDGMVEWFKIESQVYVLDSPATEKIMGRPPRIYVYKVIPYRVHRSIFQMPNDPPPGYDELEAQAVKHYNYMYTGKNKDILEFEITFDNAFYGSIAKDQGNNSGNNQLSEQGTNVRPPEYETQGNSVINGTEGQKVLSQNEMTDEMIVAAGNLAETSEAKIARQFNDALINSPADLITGRMTIMGDPYYLADSGMGNFNSEATSFMNLNADGTMNHSTSQVDILINFRTPVDISPEGVKFNGASIGVKDFSGLYQVISVNNRIEGNEFTQELDLVRRRNYGFKDKAEFLAQKRAEEKKKYEKAVATAEESGDKYDIAFAKADLNADGKLTVSEERAFMQMDGITDDDLKNAQIKKRGEADDARKADEAEKKKNLELSLQAQDDAYLRESGIRQSQTTTTNTNETGPT